MQITKERKIWLLKQDVLKLRNRIFTRIKIEIIFQ